MQYKLQIADDTVLVDFQSSAEGAGTFSMDEATYDVTFRNIPDGRLHLVVDGKSVEAFVAATEEGKHVFIAGRSFLVTDADLAPKRGRKGADNGPGEVTPPMPAVVVRLNCAVGDKVVKGQGLVVVSAMKMETTLAAPYGGTVTAVNCAVDGKVMPGEILVDIEKDEEEPADE